MAAAVDSRVGSVRTSTSEVTIEEALGAPSGATPIRQHFSLTSLPLTALSSTRWCNTGYAFRLRRLCRHRVPDDVPHCHLLVEVHPFPL